MALPPAPCASVMNSSLTLGFLRRARSTRSNNGEVVNSILWLSHRRTFGELRQSPEVVISGARAFGRNHTGADRRFWRACGAEDFAFPRFLHSFQDLTALAGLRVGDAQPGHGEARLGVESAVTLPELQTAVRDRSEASPLEIIAGLEYLADRYQSVGVAVTRDEARVLVLDLGPAFDNLFDDHRHRLQNVERLEARNDERLAVFARHELVDARADYRADVAGADEAFQLQVGRIEQRLQRGHDHDVVAEDAEITDALFRGGHHGQGGRRRGRFESEREEDHFAIRIPLRKLQ